jgi:hypothetical protein
VAALALLAPSALALEFDDVGGEALTLDVTNTLASKWRFDNRNDNPADQGTLLDDNYGEVIERLNLQAYWWRLSAGVRVDALVYVDETSAAEAADIAREAHERNPPLGWTSQNNLGLNDKQTTFYRDLHTRFLDTYYPSKLFVGYTEPGVDVTIGDFYAQLGRGLVLSVRKIDEVAIDTTIRGGKLVLDRDLGAARLGLTLLGGQLNPLRVDEPSGRRLHGDGSPLFLGFPEIDDFRYYTEAASCTPGNVCFERAVEPSRASYLEDTVFGGRLELGSKQVQLAGNAAVLVRKDDPYGFSRNDVSRSHDLVRAFSQSLSLPNIEDHGDFYLEVAGQDHGDGAVTTSSTGEKSRTPDLSGYGVYASGSVRGGPASLSLEGKLYRRLFPMFANVDLSDPSFGASEFASVAYNQLPTAEPIYVEQIGSPNQCMTGGRARVDFRFNSSTSVYGWAGYYRSYSEVDAANTNCDVADGLRSDTWDTAVGLEAKAEEGRSQVKAWVGARITDQPQPDPITNTDAFYREGYIRYDFVKHLVGHFSLQMQGFHRHRSEPIAFKAPWNEGENYAALQWAPHLTAIFGYEYLGRPGCEAGSDKKLCHYMSGGLQWRSGSTETAADRLFDTVAVFVGQQRGAIRCVSGNCRQFPPFEGARLEVVSRF